jgi:hypothetical protein
MNSLSVAMRGSVVYLSGYFTFRTMNSQMASMSQTDSINKRGLLRKFILTPRVTFQMLYNYTIIIVWFETQI